MPVDFLSDEQASRYGRFVKEPSPEQLSRYFYLDARDRHQLAQRRGDHNRLGFALQLGTVRFLGTFLADPTDVSRGGVRYLAQQLGIEADSDLMPYRTSETHWDYANIVKRHYGYRDFHDSQEFWSLVRWLYSRAGLSPERPSVRFDLATARLVERKALLPGVTTLTQLVATIRERTALRLWRILARSVTSEQRSHLEALLRT